MSRKKRVKPLKIIIFWLISAVLGFILIESFSSLALFHVGHLRQNQSVTFSYSDGRLATWQFGKKVASLLGPTDETDLAISSSASPLFIYHATLGYTIISGTHEFTLSRTISEEPLHRQFSATIWKDGTRATSYSPKCSSRKILIFGDSMVWGWGNNDQQTFPWLLQTKYPGYKISNYAMNGYGNIHAMIQIQNLKHLITADDILIIVYADFYNIRNVAAPSRIRAFNTDRWRATHSEKAEHPYGFFDGGELQVGRVGLRCEINNGYCNQDDPEPGYMREVTKAIIAKISGMTDARVVVAYTEGKEDDPVLSFLQDQDITVLDVRPRQNYLESDDFAPLDFHPGPLTQYHYFATLSDFFERRGWIVGGPSDELDVAGAENCAPQE